MAKTQTGEGTTRFVLKILLIVAAGFWIYSPAYHGAWYSDDELYLPQNPLLHDPARLWKIWFAPGSFIEYYPLEETVQWAQWQLWGNDTFGYHLTNVFLHILNSLLVWRLLQKFGLKLAWLGGVIFMIHPAAVESVAWIAELKNTLSLAPFLLSIQAWMDYEDAGRPRDYFLALAWFAAAMLCKISMAPFPVVILLYAWWKRGKIGWSDLRAALPFFIISLALGITTIAAGAWFPMGLTKAPRVVLGGFFSRAACSGLAFAFYWSQFFWPARMMPMYPQWTIDPRSLREFLPWPVLFAGTVWLWTRRKTWGRHALLGCGFFFLFLAPFLGFHEISYMQNTRVMDHFLYLPVIGLIGLVVAAAGDLADRLSGVFRAAGAGAVALVCGLLAWESHDYARVFASPLANSLYLLKHNPNDALVHNGLGNQWRKVGRIPAAIAEFKEASRLNPSLSDPHNNLAGILLELGRYPEAVVEYRRALELRPDSAEAHNGLANTLCQTGNLPEAIREYEEALRIEPAYDKAHNGLATAYLQSNRLAEAWTQCELALKSNPNYAFAHCTQGSILIKEGRISEAIGQFQKALSLDPGNGKIESQIESLQAAQQDAANKGS